MSGVKHEQPRRHYRSPVRDEGARRTRCAIVVAAGTLFGTRGYNATSLLDIAAAAGVARPTVTTTFGSKPALLRAVIDDALAGNDEQVPVADRAWFRPVWEAGTHEEVLTAYAQVCALIGSRAARLFEVVRGAAHSSPDVAELWESTRRNRRAGARMVVDQLLRVGPVELWPGDDRAVDALWFFNDPAHYDALVLQCHWPDSDFTKWLAARMQDALLHNPPPPGTSPARGTRIVS